MNAKPETNMRPRPSRQRKMRLLLATSGLLILTACQTNSTETYSSETNRHIDDAVEVIELADCDRIYDEVNVGEAAFVAMTQPERDALKVRVAEYRALCVDDEVTS